MKYRTILLGILLAPFCTTSLANDHVGDFSQWALEYEQVIKKGEELFADPFFSENGKSCAECHPKAQNTHPGTYPKYRKSQQRVIQFWEMVNWCVTKALGKPPLAADSAEMTALVAYITHENKGAALKPGGP